MTGAGAFVNRALTHLGLSFRDLKNLSSLYLATFVMRAASYAGVAVMQHVIYPGNSNPFWKGLLFSVYPLAEIASVGYFGALCDRIGRKRVLVFAYIITSIAVFLFAAALNEAVPDNVEPYLVAVFFAMFGVGAAANVSSTLTMVNDSSNNRNRAQLMAVFDLATLAGFAGGFGAGYLGITTFGLRPEVILVVGGVGILLSLVLVALFVRDTRFVAGEKARTWDLLRSVLKDRDILRLLPVYIPVIALYGYVITFADHLLGGNRGEPLQPVPLLVVTASLGVPLVASMLASSRFSDRSRVRKPFMAVGLLCFGGLAILISMVARPDGGIGTQGLMVLYSRWPLLVALAAGAGAFPPAALAYLGDIVKKAVSGTTFGLYSIIFGSGLIIGPILGGTLAATLGAVAFIVIALGLIGISFFSVLFLREPSKTPSDVAGRASTGADPP